MSHSHRGKHHWKDPTATVFWLGSQAHIVERRLRNQAIASLISLLRTTVSEKTSSATVRKLKKQIWKNFGQKLDYIYRWWNLDTWLLFPYFYDTCFSDSVTRVTIFGDSYWTRVTLWKMVTWTRLESRFKQNYSTSLKSPSMSRELNQIQFCIISKRLIDKPSLFARKERSFFASVMFKRGANFLFWLSGRFMLHFKYQVFPEACRGLVMPGATAWLNAPLPNSSIEHWRMVIIVSGYTGFVTSQYDVIFTFDTTCIFRDAEEAVRKQSRRHGGAFRALVPPNKAPRPIKLNYEELKIGGVFIKFQNVKRPWTYVKPPIENSLATVLKRRGSNKTVEGNGNL